MADDILRLLDETPRALGGLTQAAVHGAAQLEQRAPATGETRYASVDLADKFAGAVPRGSFSLHVPSVEGPAPELFWGVNMQLFTYMGVENPWLAMVGDMLTDPVTWIPGVGGVTRGGKFAALMSAATAAPVKGVLKAGAKGQSARAAWRNVKTALEGVGAIKGNPDYARRILSAGRKGASKSEIKALAQEGIELAASGKVDPEVGLILEQIKSNPKGVQDLIRAARTLGDESLGPAGFLQRGRGAQTMAGQRSQYLSLEKPYAWISPAIRTRYKNATFLDPITRRMSGAIGQAVDAIGGTEKTLRGLPDPIEALSLRGMQSARRAAEKTIGTSMRVGANASPAVQMHQMRSSARALGVIMAGEAGLVHGLKGVGGEDITAAAKDLWKAGGKRSFKAMGVPLEDVEDMVVRGSARAYERDTALAMDQYVKRVDDALAAHSESAVAAGIPDKTVQEELASLRKVYEVFSPDSVINDVDGLGQGVVARVAYGDILSEAVGFAMDDMIRATLPRADVHGGKELLGSLLQAPEAFDVSSGTVRLAKGALGKARKKGVERRLAATLEAYPEIARRLEGDGLPMQLMELAGLMRESFDVSGRAIVRAGAAAGLVQDYLPHAIKNIKKTPGGPRTVRELIDQVITDADKSKIAGNLFQRLRREGKIDAAHARRLLDDQLLKLEERGLLEVEKDAVHLWSRYMTAANRAVTQSALYTHTIRTAPRTLQSWWPNRTWPGGRTPPSLLTRKGFDALDARAQAHYQPIALADRLWDDSVQGAAAQSMAAAPPEMVGKLTSRKNAQRTLGARLKDEGARLESARQAAGAPTKAKRGSLYRQIVEGAEIDLGGGKSKPITYRQLQAWVERGHIPRGVRVTDPQGLKQRMKMATSTQRKGLQEATDPASLGAAQAASKNPQRFTMYVHEQLYPHFSESFRYYDPLSQSKFTRQFQKVLRNVKAYTLVADFFHYNVLAYAGMAATPKLMMAQMANPALRGLKTQVAAGVGGAAAAGAASDGDATAMATGGVAGFLWMRSIAGARANSVAGRRQMLNPAHAETMAMMARGGATGRPHHHAIGLVEGWLRSAGRRGIPGASALADGQEFFERELWSLLHQGTKAMYFDQAYHREIERLTEAGRFVGKSVDEVQSMKDAVAREVVMTANLNTGSLRMAHFLKDPEHLRILSNLQFAPDYNMARLGHASAIFANMSMAQAGVAGAGVGIAADLVEGGFDPDHMTWNNVYMGAAAGIAGRQWMQFAKRRASIEGKVLQREALRIYRNAVMGVYTMSNLLNYGFTGRWMYQNPEGYQMSIAMGQDDGGRDVYMSLGKPHVEALELAHLMHKEKNSPPVLGFAIRKAHPVLRMTGEVAMNRNYWGGPVYYPEDSAWEQGSQVFAHIRAGAVPIAAGGLIQAGGRAYEGELGPVGVATTGLRTAGFPTKRTPSMVNRGALRLKHTTLDQLLGQ